MPRLFVLAALVALVPQSAAPRQSPAAPAAALEIFQSDNDDPPACRVSWVMEDANFGFSSNDGQRSWQADRQAGAEIASGSDLVAFLRANSHLRRFPSQQQGVEWPRRG